MCRYLNLPSSYKESLIKQRHPKHPVYPSKEYLKKHRVKRQNKICEDRGLNKIENYFI